MKRLMLNINERLIKTIYVEHLDCNLLKNFVELSKLKHTCYDSTVKLTDKRFLHKNNHERTTPTNKFEIYNTSCKHSKWKWIIWYQLKCCERKIDCVWSSSVDSVEPRSYFARAVKINNTASSKNFHTPLKKFETYYLSACYSAPARELPSYWHSMSTSALKRNWIVSHSNLLRSDVNLNLLPHSFAQCLITACTLICFTFSAAVVNKFAQSVWIFYLCSFEYPLLLIGIPL